METSFKYLIMNYTGAKLNIFKGFYADYFEDNFEYYNKSENYNIGNKIKCKVTSQPQLNYT